MGNLGLGSGLRRLGSTADSEPIFDVDTHKIDGKPFVRATFPNRETEAIYGFATRADAIKWIRCEAVVWLYERRKMDAKKIANSPQMTARSLLYFAAAFWVVVGLTHIAERLRIFPAMGWGLPNSPGHYLDLLSAIAGGILLLAAFGLWLAARTR
jgi:hypothetical protein